MTYVYILRSIHHPGRHYIGVTSDLRARLQKHNAGEVPHTAKYSPWTIKTYVALLHRRKPRPVPLSRKRHLGRKSISDGVTSTG